MFQSESTLFSCLNVKELLAQSRRDIWSLSGNNGTRTHNHLVCKATLHQIAKLITDYVNVGSNPVTIANNLKLTSQISEAELIYWLITNVSVCSSINYGKSSWEI